MRARLLIALVWAAQWALAADASWKAYLGGPGSEQFSSLTQINKTNVNQLQVAWTYATGEKGNYLFNPLIVDGTMYVLARNNSVVALDAVTGKERWTHANTGAVTQRGINYWETKDRSDRRLLYLNAGYLTAIDARTGNTIPSFGDNGRVDIRVGLDRDIDSFPPLQTNNPGRIFENLFIIPLPARGDNYAAVPADVHAYDTRTGKLVWIFHSVPHPGEVGYETWPKDFWKTGGGVHNWNEMTVDENVESPTYRSAPPGMIFTARTATGRICLVIVWSRWTHAPASSCGISKPCITICGITTCPPRPSC